MSHTDARYRFEISPHITSNEEFRMKIFSESLDLWTTVMVKGPGYTESVNYLIITAPASLDRPKLIIPGIFKKFSRHE